jgi:hypothetical protein
MKIAALKRLFALSFLMMATAVLPAAAAVDVTTNGLKADAVLLVDGSCTASSATFNSASAAFSASDIGKTISAIGCGPSNSTLVTTIAAYISPSQITMAAAAGTTKVGAIVHYGTNNTGPLTALIAALGTGCDVMDFPKGNYLFSGVVNVTQSSCNFEGRGKHSSTVLWYVGNGTNAWFDVASVSSTRFFRMTMRSLVPDWTGPVAAVRNSGGGDPSGTTFEQVNISPGPGSYGLNLDTSINVNIAYSDFNGGTVGILGRSSGSSYSNNVNMLGGQFRGQSVAPVYIGGEAWAFRSVTFEGRLDSKGVAFVGDSAAPAYAVTFDGNWFGDATVAGKNWITYWGYGLRFVGNQMSGASADSGISMNNVKGYQIAGNVFSALNSAIDYTTGFNQGGYAVLYNSHHNLSAFETNTANKDFSQNSAF